jgi:hypothetical protein
MKMFLLVLAFSFPLFGAVVREVNCELKESTEQIAPVNYLKIRTVHDSALGERSTSFHFKLPPGFYEHTDFNLLTFEPALNRATAMSIGTEPDRARLELDNYRQLHGILRVGDDLENRMGKRKTYLYGNCR